MARVNIENAEVTSVMNTGKGFRCQNIFKKRDGGEIVEKWVIWSDSPVNVGDVVNVDGLFSKKDEVFTNKEGEEIKYTALHVNNPNVSKSQMGPVLAQKGEAAIREQWPALNVNTEAPF
jgi:hypothetical protein